MKLTFVKNIKNSKICDDIFLYKLNNINKFKPRSNCFIKEYREICEHLQLDPRFVYEYATARLLKFKQERIMMDVGDLEEDLIRECFDRGGDIESRKAVNFILFAGN
jgi:tRNA U38,U39,U40 pseudouridine synthase TruA